MEVGGGGGLSCKGCMSEVNYKANLPRILICCGHTLCQACLTKVLNSSKRCPNCRKVTKNKDISGYPVNRALLDIKNQTLDKCRVAFFKKCQEDLLKRKLDLEGVKPQLQATLDLIEYRVREIKDFQEKMADISNPELIKVKVTYFEHIYTDILNQLTIVPVSIRDSDFRSKSYLTASEYLTEFLEADCLSRIFTMAWCDFDKIKTTLTAGKPVVALFNFKSLNLEAQVTLKRNRLCLHTYRSESEADTSKTVCYRDFQDVMLRDGAATAVYAFLEIGADEPEANHMTILIKIFKSTSYLGSQFLKFCTGEIGCYKGEKLSKSENEDVRCIVQVRKQSWEKDELDNYATYFIDKANYSVVCSPENYYVHMDMDGGFDIFKCKDQTLKRERVIGQVVEFEGEMDECEDSSLCIVECGIAFDFE